MVFQWSWSDSKSPQVSRTLLSILAVLNNAVVWMESTRTPTSESSSPFNNPLANVPNAPIIIRIIVTFMFHFFFQFPSNVEVLILLFIFFQFYSVVSRDSKVDNFASSCLLAEIKWSVCISKSNRSLCVLLSKTDAWLCIYHLFEWSNFNFCTSCVSTCRLSRVCYVSLWPNKRHNKDERHSSLEKYTSHFLERVVWEGVGDQTDLQHIDPHSVGHNRVSFPFSWATQRGGLWAQPLWDMFLIPASSILFRVLVFSTASYLQLTDFRSSPRLYNCSTSTFFLWASQIALNSTRPRSRLYRDIPRPDAPVIYTGAFPILSAWPGSICYICIDYNWRP